MMLNSNVKLIRSIKKVLVAQMNRLLRRCDPNAPPRQL